MEQLIIGVILGGVVTLGTQYIKRRWDQDDAAIDDQRRIAAEPDRRSGRSVLSGRNRSERFSSSRWRTIMVSVTNGAPEVLAPIEADFRLSATEHDIDPEVAWLSFQQKYAQKLGGGDSMESMGILVRAGTEALSAAPTTEISDALLRILVRSIAPGVVVANADHRHVLDLLDEYRTNI